MLIYGLNNKLIDSTDSFGSWLKIAIANAELSQTELAKKLRMSQTAVSAWTLGHNKPQGWPTVKLLCDIVGADAEAVWTKWF